MAAAGFALITDGALGTERFDGVKEVNTCPSNLVPARAIGLRRVECTAKRLAEVRLWRCSEAKVMSITVSTGTRSTSRSCPADGVVISPGPGQRGRGAARRPRGE